MHSGLEPVGMVLSCDLKSEFGFFLVATLKHPVSRVRGVPGVSGATAVTSPPQHTPPHPGGSLRGPARGGWAGTGQVGDGRSQGFSCFAQAPEQRRWGEEGCALAGVSGATWLQRGLQRLPDLFCPSSPSKLLHQRHSFEPVLYITYMLRISEVAPVFWPAT